MALPDSVMPVLMAVVPVVGGGLIAWGKANTRIDSVEKQLETRASKEVVDRVEVQLERIENKLDRVLTRDNAA